MKYSMNYNEATGTTTTEVSTFIPVTDIGRNGQKRKVYLNMNAIVSIEEPARDFDNESNAWITMLGDVNYSVVETVDEVLDLVTIKTEF